MFIGWFGQTLYEILYLLVEKQKEPNAQYVYLSAIHLNLSENHQCILFQASLTMWFLSLQEQRNLNSTFFISIFVNVNDLRIYSLLLKYYIIHRKREGYKIVFGYNDALKNVWEGNTYNLPTVIYPTSRKIFPIFKFS